MKIIDGMNLICVDGKMVAVSTGEATKVYRGFIKLNGSAYKIWTCLEKGLSFEDIASSLCTEYSDLTYEKALACVKEFADKLIKKGVLVEG